jgi:TonB family protein
MARVNSDDPGELRDSELSFLLPQAPRTPSRQILRAALGSIIVHAAIAVIVFSLPDVSPSRTAPVIVADLRRSIKLVAPRDFELTQKDPNKGKVTRRLDVRSALPAPEVPVPPAPVRAPALIPGLPAQSPPPAPVIEAPGTEIASTATLPTGGPTPQLPPPPDKANDKPKLAFESLASASVRPPQIPAIPVPRTTVQESSQAAARPSSARGSGISVGDTLEEPPTIPLPNQMPAAGRMGSNLQLLSDPNGVDFKPYLIQVLAAVRHNWLAVIPESAHMGRRGLVLIQFIIDRHGLVPKLVIASPSGTSAFDRAAVAGISASYPFPPLPANYKGEEIRLQLAFSYNMKR